ncbi:MAG: nucleoside triphosphate pyrophosphohydrolase [Sphaerochaetaceae bacterium]|nr:nucleoside triphosphate pyrophosphohydrolase [Sphaerochaetaceae bacterium]
MIEYTLEKSDNVNDCFKNLYDIVTFLRDPKDGCPWDKEQMPSDIIRSMQGEIYEYIDALSDKDNSHVSEELGDVFLNLFLLAKIHDQNGDFKLSSCINDACEKYIRRHPHVFKDQKLDTSAEVLENWQKIKKDVEGRKDDEKDFFYNVERNAPELERCYKISKKAAKVGFEWPDVDGVYDKVQEEINEVKEAKSKEEITDELGDVLFSVVNLCRFMHVKPQDALQSANRKFILRFNRLYNNLQRDGKDMESLSAEEWDNYWNEAKNQTDTAVHG